MIGATLMRWYMRRNFAKAMNRRSPSEWLSMVNPDIEEIYPGRTKVSGRFVGKEEFEEWVRRAFLEDMADVRFELRHLAVTNPWALGLTNTIAVEWDVEVRASRDGRTYRFPGASFIDIRRGKISSSRDYPADHQAIEAIHGIAEKGGPLPRRHHDED